MNNQENAVTTQAVEYTSTKPRRKFQGLPRNKVVTAQPKVVSPSVEKKLLSDALLEKLNEPISVSFGGNAMPPSAWTKTQCRKQGIMYANNEGGEYLFGYIDNNPGKPALFFRSSSSALEVSFTYKQVVVMKLAHSGDAPAIYDEFIRWVFQSEYM